MKYALRENKCHNKLWDIIKKNKTIVKAIIMITVFAETVTLLGILYSYKFSMNSSCEVLEQKAQCIRKDTDQYLAVNEDATPEELYEFMKTEYEGNAYINGSDTKILLFSKESGTLISSNRKALMENLLYYFNFHYLIAYSSFFYISDLTSDYKIILQIPIDRISMYAATTEEINHYVLLVAAIVVSLTLLIAFKKKMPEKKIIKKIKTIGLVWIIVSSFLGFCLNCLVSLYDDSVELISISDKISDDVDEIITMTDEEMLTEYRLLCNADSDLEEYVDGKNCDDMAEKLLYARTYKMINPKEFQNNLISDIVLKSNIWDNSLQITERLDSKENEQYIINTVVSNVLQMAMFIMLYIVLTKLLFIPDDKTPEVMESIGTKRLKKIAFFKNIADSLMSVVAMAMLTEVANDNFAGISPKTVKTITLLLAGIAALIAVVVIERFLLKVSSMKKFLIRSFVICIGGCCCCLFTSYAILFIVGYIFITFAETLVVNLWIAYPLRVEKQTANGLRQLKIITNSGRIGTLFGLVIGGILASLIPLRVTYIIAMVFLIIGLVQSFLLPREDYKGFQFEPGYLKKTVSNKAIIPLIILVVIPFGFIKYYFKIAVPLNIAKLGLSTALVAFIQFLHQFAIFFFKNDKKVKEVWKKRSTWFNVSVGLLAAAFILTTYYLINNVYIMLLLTFIVAFLQAGMSSQIRSLIYEDTGSDSKQFYGQFFVYMLGSQISKFVAPLIAYIGIHLLSVLMGVGAGGYSIVRRISNKKRRNI